MEAARARAQGIHVFAIGIGSEVERAELLGIASSPSENYVFQVGDFTALQYIREILAIKTCGGEWEKNGGDKKGCVGKERDTKRKERERERWGRNGKRERWIRNGKRA